MPWISGYPLGGSKKVVFGIAKRFEEKGEKIEYKKVVKDLIIENDKVTGIELEDGSLHKADIVVWAADGHHLLFDILKEKYMSKKIRTMYKEWIPVEPLIHVMFGVDMDLSNESHMHLLEIQKPIKVAGKEFSWLTILNHCFDKSTAPAGKSAIEVWYATDYSYWEELIKDRGKYDAEKKRIADETADALDIRCPGFKSKIEMVDVPTPATYKRYTGNWLGSPDGWYITIDNMMDQAVKRTLPGLNNFYMAGQWTAPYTGTVSTSLSGRQLSQILCRKYGREFKTR
ncbi:MAG: NAD(P)/FAD-dependent oxidoreductase [Spirochaetales bacterium]|nr:NAD(P)/FAD-dependent oxidoreductase [Spirochaetales bacterium]